MSEESLWRTPYKIIEMYPYTEPGTEITGPMIGYRLVGFVDQYPTFTYGRHDFAENVGGEYPSHPDVYRGSYVVKPVDKLWQRDAKLELENTVRNYRGIAVVSPLTQVNIARCMMETIYWVSPSPMDYVNASSIFNVPVYDSPDNRAQLMHELIKMGFSRDDISITSNLANTLDFSILTRGERIEDPV